MKETGVSLICATRERTSEINRLLESLKHQTQKTFELIVVDQNSDGRLDHIFDMYAEDFSITHIRLDNVGLALARNVAMSRAQYSWVGFPDDDCWCPPDFIRDFCQASQDHESSDGIFINWIDPSGSSQTRAFQFHNGRMTLAEGFQLVSSICLYIKRNLLLVAGGFNEKFGLGPNTVVKAGEDQELILRLLSQNAHIEKISELVIYHPINHRPWDDEFFKRIQSQGACDVYFRLTYYGTLHAWKMILFWLAAAGFNALRLKRTYFQWYCHKLYGAFIYSPRLR